MATIAEEITALSGRIQEAYDVCEAKGATMPQSKTTWNLSSTIDSIPAGGGLDIYGMDAEQYFSSGPLTNKAAISVKSPVLSSMTIE